MEKYEKNDAFEIFFHFFVNGSIWNGQVRRLWKWMSWVYTLDWISIFLYISFHLIPLLTSVCFAATLYDDRFQLKILFSLWPFCNCNKTCFMCFAQKRWVILYIGQCVQDYRLNLQWKWWKVYQKSWLYLACKLKLFSSFLNVLMLNIGSIYTCTDIFFFLFIHSVSYVYKYRETHKNRLLSIYVKLLDFCAKKQVRWWTILWKFSWKKKLTTEKETGAMAIKHSVLSTCFLSLKGESSEIGEWKRVRILLKTTM